MWAQLVPERSEMGTLEFAWFPSERFKASTNWRAFVESEGMDDYVQLERRARDDPEWFWSALLRYLQIRFRHPYARALDLAKGLPWPDWCVGGTMNMTESLLDRHLESGRGQHPAIIWESEEGTTRTLTYAELAQQVNRLASGLESLGLRTGDPVGLYLPMTPEVVIAFLALARMGCIVLPMFSGFGASAIATRLNDARAVALISADACLRRGRRIDMASVATEAARGVPTLRHLVIARRDGSTPDLSVPVNDAASPEVSWREIDWARLVAPLSSGYRAQEVPAEHPLMIVYTSGTTGTPKGTVHTHCGLTAKTGEDFLLCFDLKPADRLLWMTDFGWLVGPLQVTAVLLAGGTLVIAEGTPDFPELDRLWRLVAAHQVSFLGIGPTVARMMMRHGDEPCRDHDLSSLRVAASTGEPWDARSWLWVFHSVLGSRAPLMNYSGGTEVGGLLATNVLYPIKPGSFSGPIPGTGADIVDADGNSLPAGEVGELVMRQASIGTTRGLWRDPERYLDSYWRRIPGMWVHGDWASRDRDGAWFIHGRSDDTIKIAGKRTGPAEIEAALLATRKVADAVAVAIPDDVKGAALVCAVVPVDIAHMNDPGLREELCEAVVKRLGGAFRPKDVIFVPDLPRTRNMKPMRRVVRAALLDQDPGDVSTLMNPEAIEAIRGALRGATA